MPFVFTGCARVIRQCVWWFSETAARVAPSTVRSSKLVTQPGITRSGCPISTDSMGMIEVRASNFNSIVLDSLGFVPVEFQSRFLIVRGGSPRVHAAPWTSPTVGHICGLIAMDRRAYGECEIARGRPSLGKPERECVNTGTRWRLLHHTLCHRGVHLLPECKNAGQRTLAQMEQHSRCWIQNEKNVCIRVKRRVELETNGNLLARILINAGRGEFQIGCRVSCPG